MVITDFPARVRDICGTGQAKSVQSGAVARSLRL